MAAKARSTVLVVLLILVPLFVDLRTIDIYNVPKLTVLLIGALAIAAIWAVEAVRPGQRPLWRNGLHLPVLALMGWTVVTTATSVSPRMSILGAMDTNDGLIALAAFAIVFFASAQGRTLGHVKAVLGVLYYGAGGLVVLYGLIQLHDRLVSGPPWDWLRDVGERSTREFASSGIFSTFGNPNHLAGFLAVLVPMGLVLLVLHKSRPVRALTLAIMYGLLIELRQTASRGAMVATLVALVVAAVLLRRDLPRRPKVTVPAVGAVAAFALVAIFAVVAVPESSTKSSSGLDAGGTLSLRADLWKTGVVMANDRPLLGHGPDTWTDRVTKYRGADIVERHGPGVFSNGAHNVFIGQLAATGYPGLVLFLALLGLATLRAVGTWRRLRHIEASGRDDEASRARTARLLLVAVVGGLLAYLIGASFNVSQIGLSFVFWVLLGVLCALSLAAGVPATLRPRALVARPAAPGRLLADAELEARDREAGGRRSDGESNPASGAVAVLACVGLVVGIAFASRLTRADHNAWAARVDVASAVNAPPDKAKRLHQRAATRRSNAINLNPWEPTYLVRVADEFYAQARSSRDRSPTQLTALHRARDLYGRAIALKPHAVPYLERYADVLLKIHDIDPADAGARTGAIEALRRAISADPTTATRTRERLERLLAG